MNTRSPFRIMLLAALLVLAFSVATAQERVQVRWFVGLGAGTDAPTIAAQEEVVEEFNASQDDIELVLEIVDNAQAYDVLNTQIAAGNAPDIVGPMGIRGRSSFPGAWLDLSGLIESTEYDLSDFDPALVEFYKVEGEGQLGIPFAVFPYFLTYNTDLFDEAGLPYPPTAYGEPYVDADGVEHEWNIETVTELAKTLTVDENGNDANSPDFDPDAIVQWGFGVGFTDVRGRDTLFGPGNFVDAEGNAVIPENWRAAEHWYHDAMYEHYFYPSGAYAGSDLLADGNYLGSGNVAMMPIHTWYMGWGTSGLDAGWDLAPIPSVDGVVTAKLHADTFGILESSDNPEEAFTVLSYLLGDKAQELSTIYGGMPARLSLQDSFFDAFVSKLETDWPNDNFDVNWDVVPAALAYPDNPNHEEGMPSFLEASARYAEYQQIVDNNPDADVDAELDDLQADLQAIFDAAR
jgi:multiple sugar transport system substrate-binding protein